MAIIKNLFDTTKQNSGTITAGSSETFFSDEESKSFTSQYGSFNYLEVINDSNVEVYIDLDGLTSRRRVLFGKSVMVIKAEEGIYFNNVKVTDADASTSITASQLTLISRISKIMGV